MVYQPQWHNRLARRTYSQYCCYEPCGGCEFEPHLGHRVLRGCKCRHPEKDRRAAGWSTMHSGAIGTCLLSTSELPWPGHHDQVASHVSARNCVLSHTKLKDKDYFSLRLFITCNEIGVPPLHMCPENSTTAMFLDEDNAFGMA